MLPALSGLLLALAFPPLALWPLAFVALAPLYRGVAGSSKRHAFASGGLFALTLFGIGMFWMNALATPLWAVLCLIQALFFGVWAVIAQRLLPPAPSWARPMVFASTWVLFEWARSLGVYAFPWFLLAASQTAPLALPFAQAADLGGQWLVGFALAAINGYVAEAWQAKSTKMLWPAAAIVLALGGYGAIRLFVEENEGERRAAGGGGMVRVAIVQQSEDKSADWNERLRLYVAETRYLEEKKPALIVWPEGSIHVDDLLAVDRLSAFVSSPILTGTIAYVRSAEETRPRNIARLSGSKVEYVKRRLAPFGEVYPFRKQLQSVYQSFGVNVDSYVTGESPVVFDAGALKVAPLICYESAFPWAARESVRAGADSLAFLTSDQTFDGTPELVQHLGIAQLRCIETRRFGMRAASSGISAIVEPSGKVSERLENGMRGALISSIAPQNSQTLSVQWGDWFVGVCAAIAFAGVGLAWRARRVD